MSHDATTAHGPTFLQHHFDTPEQQYSSSKLGLWLFLVTEILLFGGLFVAYIIFRGMYPDAFREGHHELNRIMGGINTIVLIVSSFTMAMGVRCTQRNDANRANQFFIVTLFCGLIFLIIKYLEYEHKIEHGLLPAGLFHNDEFTNPKVPLFFSLYFMMTGLHGIHVVAGMSLIGWVLYRSNQGHFSAEYYTPVELTGLYWHLVDLIWIYLFPLFYLIG